MNVRHTHTQEALVRLDFDGDPTNISQTFDEYLVGSWLGSWHLYLYCNCLTITSKLISGLMKLKKIRVKNWWRHEVIREIKTCDTKDRFTCHDITCIISTFRFGKQQASTIYQLVIAEAYSYKPTTPSKKHFLLDCRSRASLLFWLVVLKVCEWICFLVQITFYTISIHFDRCDPGSNCISFSHSQFFFFFIDSLSLSLFMSKLYLDNSNMSRF